MCDWTDSSTSSIERECHAGPHPKLERDLQQEVEGGRQPLRARMLEVARTVRVERALPSNQVVNAASLL